MSSVRRAAVAGAFYPENPAALEAAVRLYLAESAAIDDASPPKAVIAPHAGYIYSGPVAASAYAHIAPLRGKIRRVVLLGPCHRVAVRGLAATAADFFETPLGRIPIDREAVNRALELPQVHRLDQAHLQEHSLEVQLPFLQIVLGDFELVPFAVGDASPMEVGAVIDLLWGGPETLIVVSSDLSHYLGYDTCKKVDAGTAAAIERMDDTGLERDQACGRIPIAGLLHVAKHRGLAVRTLDVRNSGDTAGPRDRVVGYGSWMFSEPENRQVPEEDDFGARTRLLLERHGPTLLHMAAASIEHGMTTGTPMKVILAEQPADLREPGAAFVTLKIDRKLRGCIGSSSAYRPLATDVADNAFAAAFRDPRFKPVTKDDLPDLSLSISVLSPHAEMTFRDQADLLRQLRPRHDGLIIEDHGRRALFLPVVWEQLRDPRLFLEHLKTKSGLDKNHWSPTFKAWRFVAEEISDSELPFPRTIWSNVG